MKFIPSPNKSSRRGKKVSHIVIHAMGGSFNGSISWFSNPKAKVSAHYLISKSGETVKMVEDKDKAWHANNANSWTIGIELEDGFFTKLGNGKVALTRDCRNDPNWATEPMLKAAAEIVYTLMIKHSIPIKELEARVVGHDSILMRKYGNNHKDPGKYFPWSTFYSLVREHEKNRLDSD